MIKGKRLELWEAMKYLDEGKEVYTEGTIMTFILSKVDGKLLLEGEEINSISMDWKFYESIERETHFADNQDKEHYWINALGSINHHPASVNQEDMDYGNVFRNKDTALWYSKWLGLHLNLGRLADFYHIPDRSGRFFLAYESGKLCIQREAMKINRLGVVYFPSYEVADSARKIYGELYKELCETAPDFLGYRMEVY